MCPFYTQQISVCCSHDLLLSDRCWHQSNGSGHLISAAVYHEITSELDLQRVAPILIKQGALSLNQSSLLLWHLGFYYDQLVVMNAHAVWIFCTNNYLQMKHIMTFMRVFVQWKIISEACVNEQRQYIAVSFRSHVYIALNIKAKEFLVFFIWIIPESMSQLCDSWLPYCIF